MNWYLVNCNKKKYFVKADKVYADLLIRRVIDLDTGTACSISSAFGSKKDAGATYFSDITGSIRKLSISNKPLYRVIVRNSRCDICFDVNEVEESINRLVEGDTAFISLEEQPYREIFQVTVEEGGDLMVCQLKRPIFEEVEEGMKKSFEALEEKLLKMEDINGVFRF